YFESNENNITLTLQHAIPLRNAILLTDQTYNWHLSSLETSDILGNTVTFSTSNVPSPKSKTIGLTLATQVHNCGVMSALQLGYLVDSEYRLVALSHENAKDTSVLAVLPFDFSDNNQWIPPVPRLAIELRARSLHHSWLTMSFNLGSTDPLVTAATASRSALCVDCEDPEKRRLLFEFTIVTTMVSPQTDLLFLSMTLNTPSSFNLVSRSFKAWPTQKNVGGVALDSEAALQNLPFFVNAARNGNTEASTCVNDATIMPCSAPLGDGSQVHCLTVSKCPVDTAVDEDFVVLLGRGLEFAEAPGLHAYVD
ncbi:MAG: hypothetical protein MHM6MM_009250, partial [Cercozoa sp. M6MM]